MRIYSGIIGLGFVIVGSVVGIAALTAFWQHRDPMALTGVLLSLVGIGVGQWEVRSPRRIKFDKTGMSLELWWHREERIPWDDIESYRKTGLVGGTGRAVDDANIERYPLVVLRYRHKGGVRTRLLSIRGVAPAFTASAKLYRTPLDDYIPDKQR